jgi:hypothetical protein
LFRKKNGGTFYSGLSHSSLATTVLQTFLAKLPYPGIILTMSGHNFFHANREAGNLRPQASRDVVQPGIWIDLLNTLLLELLPRSISGFCWAVCIDDQILNGVTCSLAYQSKHAINTTNCQCSRITWQVMCTVDDIWADSRFPERLQSPKQEQLRMKEQLMMRPRL